MTYGLQITNYDNQILVDSEFEHFHFAGKARMFEGTRVPQILDGNNTENSTTAGQYMSSSQVNGDIFKYILLADADASSPAPICFLKPVATGSTAPRCGIVLTQRSGPDWVIWVLQTRGYAPPTMYCFLPLRRMLSIYSEPDVNDNFSLATFSSSGVRTYDARVRPLKVIASGSITSPPIARAGAKANGFDPVFTPDTSVNASFPVLGSVSDLMFYCPSIAHSCQDHTESYSGDGFQTKGYNSYFYAWARQDLWWCFYRSTFRIISDNQIQSGYDIYASGHIWKSVQDNTSILGAVALVGLAFLTFGATLGLIAVAVGSVLLIQAFTNAGVASGTYYPYKNSSRNAAIPNGFMISRASYYE